MWLGLNSCERDLRALSFVQSRGRGPSDRIYTSHEVVAAIIDVPSPASKPSKHSSRRHGKDGNASSQGMRQAMAEEEAEYAQHSALRIEID